MSNNTTTARTRKPVLCIETGIVYASTHEAARVLNVPQSGISNVANGKREAAGGYRFKFVTEPVKITTITRHSAVTVHAEGEYTNKNCKPVLCIESGKIYASCKAAAEDIGVSFKNISSVITGRANTCKGMHFVLVDNVKEKLDDITAVIRTKNEKEKVLENSAKEYADKLKELENIYTDRLAELKAELATEKARTAAIKNKLIELIETI